MSFLITKLKQNKSHIRTTCGIKNCRFSRLFKGCSPLQPLCNLIGNRPQTATFHTATVRGNPEKGKIPLSYEDNDQKVIAENQRLMWSLVRIRKKEKIPLSYEAND